jgi:dihydroxyacetone kinase
VHKIAGAAAASSKGLSEVRDVARRVCSRMGTLGFALDSVTVPGADSRNDRLDENTIEIGLGIHGEAGTKALSLALLSYFALLTCFPTSVLRR